MSYVYPRTDQRLPHHVLLDRDMVDWFLADPGAAMNFFRQNRVQVLDESLGLPRFLILTRDSVPGVGRGS